MTDGSKSKNADFGFDVKRWRKRGNFYHAVEPVFYGALASQARLAAGKDPLILAPGNRVKMWLEGDSGGRSLGWKGVEDVIADSVAKRSGDLHEAYLDAGTWFRVMRNKEGDDDEQLSPIDACIEGVFGERERAPNGYWLGRFDGLPAWMGDDVEISIAQPDSDDGAYIVMPEVPASEVPPCLRVNGVWMFTSPVGYKPWHYLLGADPLDIIEAREYDGTPLPDDDTLPIRTRRQVRDLYQAAYPGYEFWRADKDTQKEHRSWLKAATVIEYAFFGMGQTHRQAVYSRTRQRECERAVQSKTRLADKRYERRPKAYESYDFDAWLEETADRYAKQWVYESGLAADGAKAECKRAEYLEKSLAAKREKVAKAEQVASLLEAKYESVIRTMYLR